MEVHTREALQEKDRSRKQGSSAGAGLLAVLGGLMFLAGFAVLFTGGILAGAVWMFLGGLLIRAAARAGKKKPAQPARPRPAPPKQAPCTNPEPHRHFEADREEPCPNPEPHRHFETAPRKRQYDTFVQPRQWPTARERRQENLRRLYEAGLLTREEYRDELRRSQSG